MVTGIPTSATSKPMFRQRCSINDRFSLDLNSVVPHQARDLKQRIRRSHPPEVPTMHPRDRLPIVGVAEINTGSNGVCERSAQRGDARRNLIQNVDRLPFGVARTNNFARTVSRRRSAYKNAVADPHRPAVSADRLPDAARVDAEAVGAPIDRHCLEYRRKTLNVETEITRRREKGRASVLATALHPGPSRGGHRLVDPQLVIFVQRERK